MRSWTGKQVGADEFLSDGAFLKGKLSEEITGSAKGMRDHCIRLLHEMDVLEIVGTGRDGANSFNISHHFALVIAARGRTGWRNGNRAASSKSGAADVLEAGGENQCPSEESAAMLKKIESVFCSLRTITLR